MKELKQAMGISLVSLIFNKTANIGLRCEVWQPKARVLCVACVVCQSQLNKSLISLSMGFDMTRPRQLCINSSVFIFKSS
jgi:hypothetical protein